MHRFNFHKFRVKNKFSKAVSFYQFLADTNTHLHENYYEAQRYSASYSELVRCDTIRCTITHTHTHYHTNEFEYLICEPY